MSGGGPLEAVGNGSPRWMAVRSDNFERQNPAYRPTRPFLRKGRGVHVMHLTIRAPQVHTVNPTWL